MGSKAMMSNGDLVGLAVIGWQRDVLEAKFGLCDATWLVTLHGQGQHEAKAVPEYARKGQDVEVLDLRNTFLWHFMR